MAYKKPLIVAKSTAKQSFVAGCPAKNSVFCFATDAEAKRCASPRMK